MVVWAYFFLPETSGVALEDIRLLFEHDIVTRSLQDAPGGKIFLRGKQAIPITDLKIAEVNAGAEALPSSIRSEDQTSDKGLSSPGEEGFRRYTDVEDAII